MVFRLSKVNLVAQEVNCELRLFNFFENRSGGRVTRNNRLIFFVAIVITKPVS